MSQMRRWKTSGQFPRDRRIWRISEKQEDSILLSDALEGHFLKESPTLHLGEVRHASDDRDSSLDGISSVSVNTINNNTNELGSHSLCHTIKNEREDIEKGCRCFQGQFINPTGTFSASISQSQGFDTGKGISNHQQIRVSPIPNGSTSEYDGDGFSSTQSSGQNWKAPSPVVNSSNEYPRAGSLVDSLLAAPQLSKGVEITCPALKSDLENCKYPNACVEESPQSWSTASNLVDGGVTIGRVMTSEWDSNCVSAASQTPTEISSIDGSTLTLGSSQSIPPPMVPTPFSWQAMVVEPFEFTPLPEELVSDLLQELEDSEPLNTSFPSPSSKCSEGSKGCTTNDCFSHEAGLFSVPQIGRADSFSSLRNFPMLSPPAVANEPHESCYIDLSHNTHSMIPQENSSSTGHGYEDGYPEQGQVSWFSPVERNAEMCEKLHQQQHVSPYYGGNRNSNPRDLFRALNLDLDRGKSM